jgi:uncharacterized protein YkuJ
MKIPTLKRYDLVEIVWHDIIEKGGWNDKNEKFSNDGMKVKQVGYYYSRDREVFEVISSYFPKDKVYGVRTKIPLGVIKSVKKLRRVT